LILKNFAYPVFFDLDQTIIPHNSGVILAKMAYQQGFIRVSNLLSTLFWFVMYVLKFISTTKMLGQISHWAKGVSPQKFHALVEMLFLEKLQSDIFKQVYNEIAWHKNQNAEIIILSSSIQEICLYFVHKLHIHGQLCTILKSENGLLTGEIDGYFCYGQEKYVKMKSFCMEKEYDLKTAWFYSDSISDLPTLSAVGYPVCINPDKKLSKMAIKNKWPRYYWK